jgi:hypothetical protein
MSARTAATVYGRRGGGWLPASARKPPTPREPRTQAPRPRCARCRRRVPRVVPAYWDRTYRLCTPCCIQLAARFDATTWPDPSEKS